MKNQVVKTIFTAEMMDGVDSWEDFLTKFGKDLKFSGYHPQVKLEYLISPTAVNWNRDEAQQQKRLHACDGSIRSAFSVASRRRPQRQHNLKHNNTEERFLTDTLPYDIAKAVEKQIKENYPDEVIDDQYLDAVRSFVFKTLVKSGKPKKADDGSVNYRTQLVSCYKPLFDEIVKGILTYGKPSDWKYKKADKSEKDFCDILIDKIDQMADADKITPSLGVARDGQFPGADPSLYAKIESSHVSRMSYSVNATHFDQDNVTGMADFSRAVHGLEDNGASAMVTKSIGSDTYTVFTADSLCVLMHNALLNVDYSDKERVAEIANKCIQYEIEYILQEMTFIPEGMKTNYYSHPLPDLAEITIFYGGQPISKEFQEAVRPHGGVSVRQEACRRLIEKDQEEVSNRYHHFLKKILFVSDPAILHYLRESQIRICKGGTVETKNINELLDSGEYTIVNDLQSLADEMESTYESFYRKSE